MRENRQNNQGNDFYFPSSSQFSFAFLSSLAFFSFSSFFCEINYIRFPIERSKSKNKTHALNQKRNEQKKYTYTPKDIYVVGLYTKDIRDLFHTIYIYG